MTHTEVKKDYETIRNYAALARRWANLPRTHCTGKAVATIEWRTGIGVEKHDVGHAPDDLAWGR
jgi:hypothetical protein